MSPRRCYNKLLISWQITFFFCFNYESFFPLIFNFRFTTENNIFYRKIRPPVLLGANSRDHVNRAARRAFAITYSAEEKKKKTKKAKKNRVKE